MNDNEETERVLQDQEKAEQTVDQCVLHSDESEISKTDSSSWKYQDGWPEDKWQQEFDRHPFFMTKPPEPSADLHPLLEGLQQLKYGEDDNTDEELATTHKKDGLLSFKLGKYRDAILNFTAALKYKSSNELRSQLFNNRAASHLLLGNYRSALQDSQEALKMNPDYVKPKLRIPQCFFHLENYQECIDFCEKILSQDKNNKKIQDLRNNAAEKKKLCDRDKRKQDKKVRDEIKLLEAVKERNIRIKIDGKKLYSVEQLDPLAIPPGLKRVFLKENKLIWSCMIAFPEAKEFSCVRSFPEDITFAEILEDIFETIHTQWDTENRYTENTVNIYFKDEYGCPFVFSIRSTLIAAQQHPKYFQDSGVPGFFILPKNSEAEKEFLEDCRRSTRMNMAQS